MCVQVHEMTYADVASSLLRTLHESDEGNPWPSTERTSETRHQPESMADQ